MGEISEGPQMTAPNAALLALLDRGWPPESMTEEEAREWCAEFDMEVLILEQERKEAEDG